MTESIFVGVYPGLTEAMLDYMAETIRNFCETHATGRVVAGGIAA